jgi:two-component system, NtrC family, sensor kinase
MTIRRNVSARVVSSFVVMLLAFALALGFASLSLHRAAQELDDLGQGIVPVAIRLAQLRSQQETVATLVEGLADEASATRALLLTLQRERAVAFADVVAALETMERERPQARRLARSVRTDVQDAEEALNADAADVDALTLTQGGAYQEQTQRVLEHLAQVEREGLRRLRVGSDKITSGIEQAGAEARLRERRALIVVVGTTTLALALGLALTWRARRMLSPLSALQARARAVAEGDLTRRVLVTADDDLGELQNSFEEMVGAVAKAREQAVANERFAAIGKMAAHVTHEVRNPLTSIGLNLEMLEEDLPQQQGETRALLTAIRTEVERLERLSEDYLRVARLPSPRLEADDIAASVRQIVDFERPEMDRASCVVTLEVALPPPAAQFDEAQFRQAFLNLLRNARESMPQGGTIEVRVYSEGLSGIVTVSDRGPGINDESTRARMFDPFFSTKGEGTGLGLAITRQIAEAHGGTVEHHAREGGGSIFAIMLPLTASNRTQS